MKEKIKKVRNSNFDLWRRAEITLASSISVAHWQVIHQWKGLHEYYNIETQKFEKKQKSSKFEFWFVTKSWNHLSFVNISPTLVIDTSMERSSRVLQHWNPKIWRKKNQKSSKFEFWLVTKSWNHLSFVNISRTLASDTSMDRSSRVLQHGNPKIWFFLKSKLNFDLCWLAEITLALSISVLHW